MAMAVVSMTHRRLMASGAAKESPPTYSPEWPAGFQDASVKQWVRDYYRTIDNKEAPSQAAVDFYADEAVIQLGRRHLDRATLLQMSAASWDAVESRRHNPKQAYPLGGDEYLVEGDATYVYKNGESKSFEWCGKLHLVRRHGRWAMDYYKTYFATEY
ncbi:hypothetical protein BO71DRAFT_431398 [Aspergillus ellipticus CBS 707.79]|uniref:DUF4440 domain-containing protein n=1 Tax=Aspergillus ellipticus CBS 707.79 TaxID=1448320 RepID=A0A319DXK0_9EURO|nr:hypothetical protein BO71DRAFT_431398 [Aspergillus ellipticus CBS 707.79]